MYGKCQIFHTQPLGHAIALQILHKQINYTERNLYRSGPWRRGGASRIAFVPAHPSCSTRTTRRGAVPRPATSNWLIANRVYLAVFRSYTRIVSAPLNKGIVVAAQHTNRVGGPAMCIVARIPREVSKNLWQCAYSSRGVAMCIVSIDFVT